MTFRVTVEVWTIPFDPVAVTFRVYVPGVVRVVVDPPEPPVPPVLDPELAVPPPPQPEMLTAPIVRMSATSGVNLRLRGAKKKKIPAKEAAEPAYQ